MPKRTFVLVILDGWGLGRKDNSNPIYLKNPKNIDNLKYHFPAGSLQASGIAVGLPWGEEGNSEVGHLTLGAGKVIYQHFPRITMDIKNGGFFKNPELVASFEHARKNNSSVNLIGLLTEGNVHASLEHLKALIKMAQAESISRLNLHLITDGKDGPPRGTLNLLNELGSVKIASLSGRYFAMDRDLHQDRTGRAYAAMTGEIPPNGFEGPTELLDASYARDATDESIEPTLFSEDARVASNDALIFFNFREDGIRQLVEMFIKNSDLATEATPKLTNLHICTFTKYSDKFKVAVAYPTEVIENPIGRVLSENHKVQMRIAETEKYAHITYFFNGFQETPFPNEYRVLIPSRNVSRQDEFPEMMAKEITLRATEAIREGIYDFILINYANADIVGHTGNFEAALKAVQVIDDQVGELVKTVLETDSLMIITSDHGNVERMMNIQTGMPETKHDPSPVPIYLVGKNFETNKNASQVEALEAKSLGVLSDVAPTILELMGLPAQEEMTGVSLVKDLR